MESRILLKVGDVYLQKSEGNFTFSQNKGEGVQLFHDNLIGRADAVDRITAVTEVMGDIGIYAIKEITSVIEADLRLIEEETEEE